LNICFLCDEYPPSPHGGLGTFVKGLAGYLGSAGHEVSVLGAYPGLDEVVVERDGPVEVARIPLSGGNGRASFFLNRLAFARAAREWSDSRDVDVIEGFERGGWTLFLNSGRPLVIRLHNPRVLFKEENGARRGILVGFAERLALRRADGVVGVSRFMAEAAVRAYRGAGLRRRRIQVIPNGVDFSKFGQRPFSDVVSGRIVFAGTLKPQKGIMALLKAFHRVSECDEGARLVVAGKDTHRDDRSYRETLLKELKLPVKTMQKIEWLGHVPLDQLSDLYGSAQVCVFPSLIESFGLVAVEAMASGRPVIFSNRCAGPEIIDDGVSGFLVDPLDDGEIASRISTLIGNPDLSATMGEQAARSARNRFSIERCAGSTLKYFEDLINNRAPRPHRSRGVE